MVVATVILGVAGSYAVIGFIFALAFVVWGVGRVDAGARNTSVLFRLLILPGVAALWPWLALRWLRSTSAGERS